MQVSDIVKSIANKGTIEGISQGSSREVETRSRAPSPRDTSHPGEKQPELSDKIQRETREKVEKIGEMMDDYVRSSQRSLSIRVDGDTGDTIVKVISKEDGRTIREIPPEEMRHLAAKMEEKKGLLFDREV